MIPILQHHLINCGSIDPAAVGHNRSRSIYEYSNMAPRLSGQTSIFDVVFFVSKSLLGMEGQKKLKKFTIFTRKPRCQVKILIYRTWPIRSIITHFGTRGQKAKCAILGAYCANPLSVRKSSLSSCLTYHLKINGLRATIYYSIKSTFTSFSYIKAHFSFNFN